MKTTWIFAVALLVGCSSDGDDPGGTANGLEACGGNTPVYGRAALGDCLGADAPEVIACATSSEGDPVTVCAEKDGKKYWGGVRGTFELAAGFSACSEPQPLLCEFAACASTKASFSSTCSLADTKQEWACGTSDLDENCCLRTTCTGNEDCGSGEHCEQVDTIDSRTCYLDSNQTCQCAGQTGGLGAMVCVPD